MFFKNKIKRLALYCYHKYKHRHLVQFGITSYLSHRCQFGGMNKIYSHSYFNGTLGRGSYIGNRCHLSADIGQFTSIGNHVTQILESHPYKEPFVTTSPMFYSLRKQNGYTFSQTQIFEEYRLYDKDRGIAIRIGNDCWIGNDVCFIGGVQIGDGAVVLAKALVTKNVPPYAIVGGIPAKIIGFRYEEETITFLQKVQWWNMDVKWLRKHRELLCDINIFKFFLKGSIIYKTIMQDDQ